MTAKFEFIIEDKKFVVADEVITNDNFMVQSVPRPYKVSFTKKLISPQNAGDLLLIDTKVYDLYKNNIDFDESKIFKATATEEFKTLDGVIALLDFLNDHGFTKGERLIVVGGGIIQDLGAFVGACYRRGIKWTYFPTTLLSMCDSCIGGKSGINYRNAKNQVALFSAPAEVNINDNFLKTLSAADLKSGMGEILKLMIIGGAELLSYYKQYAVDYSRLIKASLAVKKAVIEVDEFESLYRRSLNYGHTLGHAIEAMSNYEISHGQAVVVGMILANELSCNRGLLDIAVKQQVNKLCFELLDEHIVRIMQELNMESLLHFLQKDKKTEGTSLNFVFLKNLGETSFAKIKLDEALVEEIGAIRNVLFKHMRNR